MKGLERRSEHYSYDNEEQKIMQLNIKINLDNSAFEDNEDELKDIFKRIEYAVQDGAEGKMIIDSNGNKVGFWEITGE
jgi:predicted AAA+ superfamily ATPase